MDNNARPFEEKVKDCTTCNQFKDVTINKKKVIGEKKFFFLSSNYCRIKKKSLQTNF